MKITIIHPSRQRPKQAEQAINVWLGNAKHKNNIEYIISVDGNDSDLMRYKKLSKYFGLTIQIGNNKSAIEAINCSAEKSNGDLIIVVSDDFNEVPYHWDELLLRELEGKSDFLVKTQDGIQKTLITLPIMDRAYYNRFGYVYHPNYVHLWADTEMTAVGHYLGKVISLPLNFIHNHHSVGKFKKDAISKKNDATWNQGKKVFNERKNINFGIENPLIKYEDIVW